MLPIYEPAVLSGITDELATIAVGCQKFGLVCTEQAEFDKYTIVIGLVGMVIGALSLLLSQYLRRRAKEK